MSEKIEYIKYEEPNLPDAETVQDDFKYGKSTEKLDANIALRNAGGLVKVSSGDGTSGYLENKLVAGEGVNISKLNPNGNEKLQISGEFIYGGDGSDGDLIIANGETVTLNAATDIQIKNYTSIDIQTGGTLTIQNTNTAPVVLKSTGNINIQGTINFNSTYNDTAVFNPLLLATGVTFTPTGKLDTNKGGTDLILNCIGNFNGTSGSINLGATSPAIGGALRIVSGGTYTAGTYTSTSTTVISNPTIF